MMKYIVGALLLLSSSVQAQTKIEAHFKDISLYDFSEMMLKEGGNPEHSIDIRAKDVNISAVDIKDTTWNEALRLIVNRFGYRVRRSKNYCIIESRVPVENGY